jgi:hypothetical protein
MKKTWQRSRYGFQTSMNFIEKTPQSSLSKNKIKEKKIN